MVGRNLSAAQQKPAEVRPSPGQGGRWRQPLSCFPRQSPEETVEAGKKRVGGIQAALAALAAVGITDSPEVHTLRQSLQKAKRVATDRPPKEQLSLNEAFIERSRRRLAELDAERLVLEKAEERRKRLVEAIASKEVPVDCQTPKSEMEILRAKVAHLEAARERRSERGSVEASEKHRARAVKRRAGLCTDDVMPSSEQPLREWLESKHFEMQDALDLGDMESVGLLTDLISRGATKIADLSHPPSVVANMVMQRLAPSLSGTPDVGSVASALARHHTQVPPQCAGHSLTPTAMRH